jgi:hypothetical protein
MSDLVTRPYALILDPLEELTDALGRVEDWLLFSDPEPGQAVVTVRAGAHATAAISRSITEAAAQAPDLYAPNNRIELAPLAVVRGDLTAALAAVRRAVQTLPSERPLAQTLPSLDLLHRCAASSRSGQADRLTEAVQSGLTRVMLSDEQYRSYRWFTRSVLTDPLDRFAAFGSPARSLDPSYRLDHGGVEL